VYIGLTETGYEGGTKRLCLATASSIEGPWTRHGAIIVPSGSAWRQEAIWHPSIVKRAGTYYLFFNATGWADGIHSEHIGYATATNMLGPWTVDDANSPIIHREEDAWDDAQLGDPSVYKVGSTWYMAYYALGEDNRARDGAAFTTNAEFPLGWVKYDGNPVLDVGPDSFDERFAHKPFIVNDGGTHYHYYTAVSNGGNRVIALAIDQ
jgi:predicted GH43/DUF377 family glycosyl hydrolase